MNRHAAADPAATALPSRPALLPRLRVTSGWQVVAGAFLVLMVGYGAAYSFAAFAEPLAQEFGTSHAATSLVYALCGGVAFLLSAVSGRIADRHGSRRPALAGMALVGAGLLLAAAAQNFVHLLLCYGLLIGCGIGLAYVPALAAVQRWFDRRRGLASGIAAAGIGLGTALVPPLATRLMDLGGGWRLAFIIAGAGAIVVGMAGALLLARSPESRGLKPEPGPHAAEPAQPPRTGLIPEAALGRDFLLLFAGCLLVSLPVALPFAHLPSFAASELGIPPAGTLHLLGLIGVASVLGRFLLGALADRIGRGATFIGCCWGLSFATLGWAEAESLLSMEIFALAFGATYGGFVALLPAFVADLYGRASAGTMIGLLYTSRGIAVLLAPPVTALAVQVAADATLPVGFAAGLGLLGSLLMTLVRR